MPIHAATHVVMAAASKKKGACTLAAAIAVGTTASAICARSWYPKECCSERDCVAADSLDISPDGDRIITIGRMQFWVPRPLVARSSPDGRIHVCMGLGATEEGDIFTQPVCLFLPEQS